MSLRNRRRAERGRVFREGRGTEPVRELPAWADGDRNALSWEIRNRFVVLAERLKQYEEFARTAKTPADKVALFEILEEVGVITPELLAEIAQFGELSQKEIAMKTQDCFRPMYDSMTGKRKIIVDGKRQSEIVESASVATTNIVYGRVMQERALFRFFGGEIARHAFVHSYITMIEIHKTLEETYQMACRSFVNYEKKLLQKSNAGNQQWRVIYWFEAASMIIERKNKNYPQVKWEERMNEQSALKIIKGITFEDGDEKLIILPSLEVGGRAIECYILPNRETAMCAICKLRINVCGVIVEGYLSRITGDVTLSDTLTVSAGVIFRALGESNFYTALREAIIAGVYQLWKDDQLKEKVEVGIEEDEEENEREVQRGQTDTDTLRGRMSRREIEEIVGTFSGAIKVEGRRGRRRAQGELSGYSWRRVLEAFRRCGVTVEMDGDHPKLRCNGKTVDYINKHSGGDDPRRNREVVNDALRKLGISKEEFIRNL